MASDEKDKWGTIFLDANRESSLSKLDAMQAASRQEQWNQKTQQDYLEKVRQKAIERAKGILGEAYTERQQILEEAEREAAQIRQEAKGIKAEAENIRSQSQGLRHDAQAELDNATHIRNGAQEEGFQAGLAAAQTEIDNFRASMGASVAGVLQAIEGQCLQIFAGWRQEIVHLLKVGVAKATGLAIDERYASILENLVFEAVRHLDERRMVTLRVHPDDEAVVADLFAAAKEKLPDLGQWQIEADASLELGGLVAESHSGSVDSRLELFRDMVEGILEHLALPESQLDAKGLAFVQKIVELESAHIIEQSGTPSVQAHDIAEEELNATMTSIDESGSMPIEETQEAELNQNTMTDAVAEEFTVSRPPDAEDILPEHIYPTDPQALANETLQAAEELAQSVAEQSPLQDNMEPLSPVQSAEPEHALQESAPENFANTELLPAEDGMDLQEAAQSLAESTSRATQEPTRQELEEELLPIPHADEDAGTEA